MDSLIFGFVLLLLLVAVVSLWVFHVRPCAPHELGPQGRDERDALQSP